MLIYKSILVGLALALAVSGAVLVLGRLLRWHAWAGWLGALAVGGGYAAGHVALLGWPPFPPGRAVGRLFYLGLAATVLAVVDGLIFRRGWVRWAVYFLLMLLGAGLLLWPCIRSSWGWGDSAAWLLGLALGGTAFRWTLARAGRRPGTLLPLALPAVLCGSAAAAFWSGSALLSQLAAVLLAALCPCWVAARRKPADLLNGAPVSVVGLLLPGLWLIGWFYGDMPAGSVLLLGSAPAAAWVARRWGPPRLPAGAILVRAAAPLTPVLLAVLWAVYSAPADVAGGDVPDWSPATSEGPGAAALPETPAPTAQAEDNPFRGWDVPSSSSTAPGTASRRER